MNFSVKKCVKLIAALGLLTSAYCHAVNGWTGYGNIAELACYSDNDSVAARCSIAGFNGTADASLHCGRPWGTLYLPAESAQNSKYLYSALLAAFSAGKKIKIYTHGCYEGVPLIGGIVVQN